jgi:hypothetical protein
VRTFLSCTGAMALISLALATPASASTVFDMEGITPGYYQNSVTLVEGPLTLTVTPHLNSSGFVEAVDPKVPLLGSVALRGSNKGFPAAGESIPLRFSFDHAINSITFNFGDAGGDDDGTVEIRAYRTGDMVDTFLGLVSDTYPASFADGKSLTLDFAGADYYIARSFGGDAISDNSIYWDISAITPAAQGGAVPEPPTWTMMLVGLLGVGWASRLARRRRTAHAAVAR